MVYLIVSIMFMSLLAVCLRLGTSRGANALGMNLVYRGAAAVVVLAVVLHGSGPAGLARVWRAAGAMGVMAAACYWLAGFAAIKTVQLGHLGVSWTVIRCAMVLPTLASLFYWHEVPLAPVSLTLVLRALGITTAVGAVVLLGIDRLRVRDTGAQTHGSPARPVAWACWLSAAFLGQGGWEICLRATRRLPDHESRMVFIALVFGGAFVLTIPMVIVFRTPIGRKELGYGIVAGVVAMFASGLRVWALRDLDGVFVFPVTAVSVTLLVVLAGRVLWHERIGFWGRLGFLAALAGMVCLTVG